jgi:DNA-3-methyladenine glycosylase
MGSQDLLRDMSQDMSQDLRLVDSSVLQSNAPEVAPRLLGALLIQPASGVRLRIIETEAYTANDPASHSFRGRTRRNQPMFGAAGCWYAYFVYGMHWCLNVVTGPEGDGQAVLLRAAKVEAGWPAVAVRRGIALGREVSQGSSDAVRARSVDGPAKLASALSVGAVINGQSCLSVDSSVLLATDATVLTADRVTTRVGISAGQNHLWRFCADGAPRRQPDLVAPRHAPLEPLVDRRNSPSAHK